MSKIVNALNSNYEPTSYSKNYVEQIISEKDKEIERLNNIINELEKWLKEYKKQCKKYDSNSTIGVINCILNKLKELKGDK